MKKICTIAFFSTVFWACNSTSTGGQSSDSSNKGSSDSLNKTPPVTTLTDTSLPHPGDSGMNSAKNMMDTASSHVKMAIDTAKKMRPKM